MLQAAWIGDLQTLDLKSGVFIGSSNDAHVERLSERLPEESFSRQRKEGGKAAQAARRIAHRWRKRSVGCSENLEFGQFKSTQ